MADNHTESPHSAYQCSLKQKREELSKAVRWDKILGYSKLLLFAFLILIALRFLTEQRGIWLLLIVAAAVLALEIVHEKVLKCIRRIKVVMSFYERGLARIEGRWAGTGETGERFIDPAHPYSRDLDIFGRGSVFELLCTLRTSAGKETLARWLLAPAQPEEIRARQAAAQELQNRREFRENLFTAGNDLLLDVRPGSLIAWGERKGSFGPRWLSILAALLALFWVASVIYGFIFHSYYPLLILSIINWTVSALLAKRVSESVSGIWAVGADLSLFAEVMGILEHEHFSCSKLRQVQFSLTVDGVSPSAALNGLYRIISNLGQRKNQAVNWIIKFIFWTEQWTVAAEFWRKEYGHRVREWLTILGEMEALAAISCYAFEHPEDSWPEVTDGAARFEADALAHPLLSEKSAVRNDLDLGSPLQVIILSGPNMSGKSTLIRGIGVNAVLAQCGAVVRAKRLRMSSLAIGASICVLDSLSGGVSRFYAEIRRLKMISDLSLGQPPLLFLLDELLSGTNSDCRLEGTKLLMNSLVETNAIGLITTHDLALTQIPEKMRNLVQNYHFEDHLENEVLVFDFQLKPGVSSTTNALKLMESVGLRTH